jgi:glutamyl-tRNA reductase
VKIKLQEINRSPLFEQPTSSAPSLATDRKIQRVLNGMASKMRRENQRGCQYIQAINEFIAADKPVYHVKNIPDRHQG